MTRYVNPFIGTGGIPWACAMLSPAACVPFGCVRLGPDTCALGGIAAIKTNTSGYYYEHQHMLGFSFGRLSGTGARDYGMFRVTPLVNGKKPSALPYSHKSEEACPGYYSVYLPTSGLLCEMTAGAHTGTLRFSNKTNNTAGIYIDASSCISSGHVDNPSITMNSDGKSFTGEGTLFGTFTGRFEGLKVYIYGEFDSAPALFEETGTGLKAVFKENEFSLNAGISFVSAENAKDNLATESNDKSFEEIRAAAVQNWEDRLSKIIIEADNNTKEIFYTALYHTMIMPTDFTDCNGEYIGFDKKIHTADGFTYRTDMSL
ncbi:MAG: glycoside hydrolase family 92 protein, partial [Clostridia bacterium]|nr:glycoside hydrolase family 92 protein [Clostridia bacterium]